MSAPMFDLPEHLAMPVDKNGDGPADGADIYRIVCWCGKFGCVEYLELKNNG